MRRIRITELIAEIRANLVAFVSIAMFVCLGLGLFLGIEWGREAIADAAERAFVAGSMHDIEVQYTYGLTEDDIRQVKEIEGVTDAEGGYVSFEIMADDNAGSVLKFQSLTERVDTPVLVKGALPTKPNEVAMLAFWAEERGIEVGDTITLEHDSKTDGEDTDGMELLTSDTFTITALVDHPAYLSRVVGMLGSANIGTGRVDCVVFAPEQAFDAKRFYDGYPALYIRCDDLRGMSTFSDEYKQALGKNVDAVGKLGTTLGSLRYRQVTDEARKQIDAGKQQVSDSERQLADGEKELADGQQQIAERQQQVDEGERQLSDGERQLADADRQLDASASQIAEGERQVADGERKLDEGERELVAGRQEYEDKKADAKRKLAKADEELARYEQLYEDSRAAYEEEKKAVEEASGKAEAVRPSLDAATQGCEDLDGAYSVLEDRTNDVYGALGAYEELLEDETATQEDLDAAWTEVEARYQEYVEYCAVVSDHLASVAQSFNEVAEAFGTSVAGPNLPGPAPLARDDIESTYASLGAVLETFDNERMRICSTEVSVGGYDVSIAALSSFIDEMKESLVTNKETMEQSGKELEEKRAEYDEKKTEFDREVAKAEAQLADGEKQLAEGKRNLAEGKAELVDARASRNAKLQEFRDAKRRYNEKRSELAQGKKDLANARAELEEAKRTLEEKRAELEDAKRQLAEAEEQPESLVEYEWVVMPRLENGSVYELDAIVVLMRNVRWAMAMLFVLVGQFVCYSAVSRLVNDEAAQIGAKKSMGFREGEIASLYLLFSGCAVVVGTVLGGLVAAVIVEGILNPASSEPFTVPAMRTYYDIPQLIAGGAIELALILLAAWLAIHGLLERNAVDLLNGNQGSLAKTRFYERWGIWGRLSLYSQTIINNCVNDPRRVIATLVGVLGCTSLIVTAVTLSGNVSRSIEYHYSDVYGFDTIVYLNDSEEDDAVGALTKASSELHMASAPVHVEGLQTHQPDGYRLGISLVVPDDPATFAEVYHVLPLAGEWVDLSGEGIWVSSGYAEHMGVGVGDTVRVTDLTGKEYEFTIDGVFRYYLMRHEFLLGKEAYRKAFGEDAQTNALFVNRNGADLDMVRTHLRKAPGYVALADDFTDSHYIFDRINRLLNTVVMIYLMLSALMAVVVLLNLDIMFVEEKKRELLVLMINGFSASDAKAYIYRDSIVLTVIGVILGVAFGMVMGIVNVRSLEPSFGCFIKDFNVFAALVGALGAAVFSTAVMVVSLRKIPRFDLTDINRF